ncbi:unnamed protein product [Allacma fusca]|uniref:Uncharacterized protein n=1 Tax=Allacma fusca TaxID=39272 RepID=A0A8J2LRB4_9HEXA|nr:unnamed protein product [Allacma fusca]
MVYTRSQLSLLESPSPACSVDGESHKGSQGAQPKRRRTISCSSTNSSLDESFGSDSTRSSGSPAKPELRKREKKIQNRQTEPRRASRLMKYYVGTTRGSNEEHSKDSKPDLLPPEPDSTSPGVTDDQVLELEAKLSPGSNIGDLDSEMRIELLSEDSSNSETVIQLCSGDEEMQSVSIVSVSDERSSLVGVSPDSLVKIIGKENGESSPTPVSSSSLCSSTTSNSGRLRVNIPNQVSQEDPYIDEIMDITSAPKLISPLRKGVASSEVCEYDCGSRDDLDSKVTQEATSVVDEMKRLDCLHEANTSVGDPIHSCTIETKLQSRVARLKEDDYVVDTKSPKQTEIEKSGIEEIQKANLRKQAGRT